MSSDQSKIIVTGAAGKLSGHVLSYLIETFGYDTDSLIATSRNPEALSQWTDAGVEVRKADYGDPTSLVEAFTGADKLLLVSTDSYDSELRLKQHTNAVAAAKEAGVKHIYYTSMPEPETTLISFGPVHLGTEQAIKQSGLSWTILRNNWYFENLLMSIPQALATGTLYTAAGDGKIAYIARTDLARAAAAALTAQSGVDSKTFTLTGTEALSIDTVAAQISSLLGKQIKVIQVPTEAIIEGAKSHGLPEAVAVMVASFDQASKAGNLAAVTTDFEKLTGSSPTPFDEWLEANVKSFEPKE
jgi:NAD(P)H dehydrogenase (quinone)